MSLLDFLKTTRAKEELALALAVIREFKEHESTEDWMQPDHLWVRLEQLEDYLKLLTGTDVETVEDKTAIEFLRVR